MNDEVSIPSPDRSALPLVRQFVGTRVDPERSSDAELVAAELVAQAVEVASGPIGVALRRATDSVTIEVYFDVDGAAPGDRPVLRRLKALDAMCSRSGCRSDGRGQTFWATIRVRPAPPERDGDHGDRAVGV